MPTSKFRFTCLCFQAEIRGERYSKVSFSQNTETLYIETLKLYICYNGVIKLFRKTPLIELRRKQDHVLKSKVWTLFNSIYKGEREREIKKWGKKVWGSEKESSRDRLSRKYHHSH